jgi:hypothetical protein
MFLAVASLPATTQTPPVDQRVPSAQAAPPAPQNMSSPAKASQESLSISISPPQLNFGNQEIGTASDAQAVALKNDGKSTAVIFSILPSGDFSETHQCSKSLGPGDQCVISVKFTPKQKGTSSGSIAIAITDDTASTSKAIPLTGTSGACCGTGRVILGRAQLVSLAPVLIIVALYLLGLILVRWNMVARPTRRLLQAQIDAVKQRAEAVTQAANPAPTGIAQVTALLTQAEQLIRDKGITAMLPDYFLWTRGQELAGWAYVHEAEEQLVQFLPPESLRASLERAEIDLRQVASPAALALADHIHESVAAVPVLPQDRCRLVLQDVLNFLAPQTVTLAGEINQALDPAASLTPDQYRNLAGKVVAVLTPQAASLADQIDRVLSSSQAAPVAQLTQLLQQAAGLLKSQAATLSQKLVQASSATPPTPVDQWRQLLTEVRDYLTPQATLLADRIRQALAADPALPINRWKALLAEALGFLYDRTDTNFANLISWHSKTVWLIWCGLLLMVALAGALQHEVLFLVGATGGLLSRLSRSLYRADVPTDYGASWTTLFLSPVVGALAGWSGILLVALGVELNVLGQVFRFDWCNPYCPLVLGLAFLLGFSERAFDGILTQLEQKVQAQQGATQPPQPTTLSMVTAAALPGGKVGQAYNQSLTVSGGTPPYKWTLTSGVLPPGLTLDPNGRISGTPTAAGKSTFTIQVGDATAKASKSQDFTVVVENA